MTGDRHSEAVPPAARSRCASGEGQVAVTGIGLVTPLGWSREITWARLLTGESGVRALPRDMGAGFATSVGAWIDAPPAATLADVPTVTHAAAVAAAEEALREACVAPAARARMALAIGSNAVEYDLHHKRALWRRHRATADGRSTTSESRAGSPVGAWAEFRLGSWLAARLGLDGPHVTLASNCVAGLQAIILGAQWILTGRAERVLAGGVERAVTPEMLGRFSVLRALTPAHGTCGSRPFDRRHDGMALGDGAGFLVLERAADARRRGVAALATIAGWGMTSDGYHLTRGEPDAVGKAAAIRHALDRAAIAPEAVDLVSAHGTGTIDNDVTEILALRRALGARAETVPIAAAKAALGHSLAASGAVESALAVLTLRDGVVPPILNLEEPAPECRVGGLLRATSRLQPRAIVKNAFAFGGFNACIVLRPAGGAHVPAARTEAV